MCSTKNKCSEMFHKTRRKIFSIVFFNLLKATPSKVHSRIIQNFSEKITEKRQQPLLKHLSQLNGYLKCFSDVLFILMGLLQKNASVSTCFHFHKSVNKFRVTSI